MSGELKGSTGQEGLLPTSPTNRLFSTSTYFLMWWSSMIAVQAFVLGQGLLPPNGQLNFFQGIVVILLSAAIITVMYALNGQVGLKYGIPFTIHARLGFGVLGSKVVQFLRIIPAIVWYGVGTWIAALSLNGITETLFGFSDDSLVYVYFVVFQILQTYLAYSGIRTMKWFNVVSSVVMFVIMLYMLISIIDRYGFEIQAAWKVEGTWGAPFFIGLTAAIGAMATVMLNISDLTRYLEKKQKAIWWGNAIGVIPPWFFMIFLGLIAGAAIGVWDPIAALMQLSPHPVVLVILLAFILLAQFSTNLTLNILPPALVFMDTLKLKWGHSVIVAGVLGAVSAPWYILGNMTAFFTFIGYYSAFFGPILGVMLADYFIIRRQQVNLSELYVATAEGQYWYTGGFNLAGLISAGVAGLIAMIWFLPASWLVGLPLGLVFYLGLFPLMVKNQYPQSELDFSAATELPAVAD